MGAIDREWRQWKYGRQFAKKGKRFRFSGQYMEIDGHVEVGDDCRFRNNVVLRASKGAKILFADRTGASYNVIMEATTLIQIGTFTGIAENTVIRDTNHVVHGTDKHWRYTPYIAEPIIIGEECLIGSGVYIGPGVTIGNGAVVSHGAIVTKNIGDYEIWAGAPARRIAHRTKNVPERVMRQLEELGRIYGVRDDRWADTPQGGSASEDGVNGEHANARDAGSDAASTASKE